MQGESLELHLLDISARRLLETQHLVDEVTQVGVVNDLLFARTDSTLMLISLKTNEQLSQIPVKVDRLEDLVFTGDRKHIGFSTDQCFTLYRLDGSKAVTFKRGFLPAAALRLENGSWLTASRQNDVHWWNSDGTEIARLPWSISLDDGVRLLDNGQLLCTNGKSVVFAIDTKGKVAAKYALSEGGWMLQASVAAVAKGLEDTNAALAVVEEKSVTKQQLVKFTHNYNVIGFSAKQVANENGKVVTGASPKREEIGNPRMWNFFYRPNERTLRNQLVEEMRAVSIVDDALLKEDTSLKNLKTLQENAARNKRRISGALFVLAIISFAGVIWNDLLMSLVALPSLAAQTSAGIFGLLSFFTFLASGKAHRNSGEIGEAIELIGLIKQQTRSFKDKVKAYRGFLLKQVPKVGVDRPSEHEVSKNIQTLLTGKIRQMALDECGLDESEINSVDADGNEIRTYINEPGYLQFGDGAEIPRAINPTNLFSFWLGPDNKPIFAVQFIQYFFLGTNKIDAFTCFYDFINDEMISNEW